MVIGNEVGHYLRDFATTYDTKSNDLLLIDAIAVAIRESHVSGTAV